MAWRRTGSWPLFELMIDQFIDVHMRLHTSMWSYGVTVLSICKFCSTIIDSLHVLFTTGERSIDHNGKTIEEL